VDNACGGYHRRVPSVCAFWGASFFFAPGGPWRVCAEVGLFGLGGWWSVWGSGSWVPPRPERRSLTRPLADSCWAICLILVRDRLGGMSPWHGILPIERSAVAQCVTSEWTDLAEEPSPPPICQGCAISGNRTLH